jgi:uncharacterized OsmC-like protein
VKVHSTSKDCCGALISAGNNSLELLSAVQLDRSSFCPVELLTGAIAACITLTIKASAEQRQFALDHVEVTVESNIEYGKPAHGKHKIDIQLYGKLKKNEKITLMRVAQSCHVSRLLQGDNEFDFNFVTQE